MEGGRCRVDALWLLLALAFCPAGRLAAEPAARPGIQFSPHGTVKDVRQVTARFAQPMVPFGDPRPAADPFLVDCPEPGASRWIDSRTWAYDFARDLPAGVRCTFTVRSGVKTLAGNLVADGTRFSFSTGGPAIQSSTPAQGDDTIEEDQAFVLVLDADATEESILAHVRFAVGGIAEQVGVHLLAGEERAAILKTLWRGTQSSPVVVLQARQRFPTQTKVRLIWGKGVAAASGVATEQDQVLEFKTRPAFTAAFRCERENAHANCIPLTPMRLRFSAPVAWQRASQIVLVGPNGQHWTPDEPETAEMSVNEVEFKGPFPEASKFRVELPADVRDDAGRPLLNAADYPLLVKTDPFPPLAKFAARFGIIESKPEAVLPVTLRNLEPAVQTRLQRIAAERAGGAAETGPATGTMAGQVTRIAPGDDAAILPWLRTVGAARRTASVFSTLEAKEPRVRSFVLPKPNGAQAFEVVGIPLESPGLYIVELASPRLGASLLGKRQPMYVPTAALVTNMSVHFKWGRENSLVWVTSLDAAQPVADAHVSIQDCRGTLLWSGVTDPQGVARVDNLPNREAIARCHESARSSGDAGADEPDYDAFADARALDTYSLEEGLLVIAHTDADLSFVHSAWNQGIEPWRFQLPEEGWMGPTLAHTVFDRSLFRAGETVHMKHMLRNRTLQGFAFVPEGGRPTIVSIRHEGSNDKFDLPLQWDAAGSAEGTWSIPKEAKLGRYQVVLTSQGTNAWRGEQVSGHFRVEEFRVPLMKALISLPSDAQVAATALPVDLTVQYLAGGGAGNLPVRLRAQIRPKLFQARDRFEHFTFANGPVKQGIVRSGLEEDEGTDTSATDTKAKPGVHQSQDLVLDATGAARTRITDLPPAGTVREVLAELEFRDPNGELQTVSSTVSLWPARWLVGIETEDWASSKDRIAAKVAVVDVRGQAIGGAHVRVEVLQRKIYSSRKRLVGGFYAYEHVEEISAPLKTLCEGQTDTLGLMLCEGPPPADGDLILQASITDEAGRPTAAYGDVFVSGTNDWRFAVADSDRIDLLPEQPRYEPGDTARLQVRMPFHAATALVTTEREGILDAWVVPLAGKDAVIDVPVKETYAPNMFVSVLVVRGRVGDVQPTAMVDLGKPAFRLGIAEIRVGWRAHELKVAVTSDRTTYTVRQKAAVAIAVRTADGAPPPPGSEVAVAAVDEGLLELQANKSWDLLDAMMGRRGYGVRTATDQMQVVGRRHFGLKALPQGGGGGRQPTRELFDTLLLWNARVPLDAQGNAAIEVPLNDSLTSFRIVAVATGGVGQFGTGSTSIRSTQDLMLLPGTPPLVRAGDELRSEFTLRNTTSRAMDVIVSGRAEGLAAPLESQRVALAPSEAKVVGWNLTAPLGPEVLRYEVEAVESGGARDQVRVAQQVRPAVPVRTLQATLLRLEREAQQPVQRPADAIAGQGGVRVGIAPTLTAGLDGVRDWMQRYPYSCLEQRISRAVALNDESLWNDIAAALPSYTDSDGLLKYFPTMTWGSDVLTSYVLAITQARGFNLPADVQSRMEGGLRKFINGAITRQGGLRTVDLPMRKLAAIAALAGAGKAERMLLGSLAIEPNLWPTSALLDWWSILHSVPGIADRDNRLREAAQIVRARLNLQGTTMGFSTERTDALWWLMTGPDTNAVRLLLLLLQTKQWHDDLPQLMRGALGRQARGHWASTITNAWGTLAVERFSTVFEAAPVRGTTTAALAGDAQAADWTQAPQGSTLDFAWPQQPADLTVHHTGSGAPWIAIQSRAAIPLTAALSSGYRITKTVTPFESHTPGRFSPGDRLNVRLDIDAQSDMTWVVVNDPIPAGASQLGTGLARDSQIATHRGEEEAADDVQPAFIERGFEAYRAYYEFVPKGHFVTEYRIRLNQSGRFQLPPTRVEALYAPEMFGEIPNALFEVVP